MLIGGISFNEKVFEGMTLEDFKELYEAAGYKTTGLTVDQLAKKLGIVKEKANEEPSK